MNSELMTDARSLERLLLAVQVGVPYHRSYHDAASGKPAAYTPAVKPHVFLRILLLQTP